MPDFSVIMQSAPVRAIVQENTLERAFHDSLFPNLLFRGEASPQPWAAGIGDTQLFTAPGTIKPNMRPLVPGVDPSPKSYPLEQWFAQMNLYGDSIDTFMPTDYVAIASTFLRNAQQLGLSGAQALNRIVRDRMYNAAESGWTVADGVQNSTTIRVKRLNGFTRARNPTLSGTQAVRFEFVSPTNPLGVKIFDQAGPAEVSRNVVGFTPDTAGDETGPGTITLSASASVLDRAYIISDDRTYRVQVGGGLKVDSVSSTSLPRLADVRSAVARFQSQNVPVHPDTRYHAHLDPISQAKLFEDSELQRLFTSLPDYYVYRQFCLGEMLGTVFFRNSECPTRDTVDGGLTSGTIPYSQDDPFAPELTNNGTSTGVPLHRILFSAQAGIFEYYADLKALISDAGITGKVADPRISNNGIEIVSDRIQLIIRAPLNRMQDMVATTWKFMGDWPVRTDAAVGDLARYKRFVEIIHGE